jgi:HD-like signal output (HDOD) protein
VSEQSASAIGPSKKDALNRLRTIPAFPAAARKLMSIMGNDSLNLRGVSDVLKSDAVLAGETLRMANSALFALRHEVTSVLHAVSVLGVDRLKSVVLTVGLRDMMKTRSTAAQRCWRHNLACALVAEYAADACGVDRASAYTAGLLHGIGYVALASCFSQEWDGIVTTFQQAPERSLPELETAVIGINHMDAADWLIRHWELPEAFLKTSRCNHSGRPAIEIADMPAVTELACETADLLGFSVIEPAGVKLWDAQVLLGRVPESAAVRLAPTVEELPEIIPYKINDFEMSFLR